LKGEAHGRSDAKASGGPEVTVAKEVSKPRTRRAVAEGSAADYVASGLGLCRRAMKVQESKCRLSCRVTGETARGPGDEL